MRQLFHQAFALVLVTTAALAAPTLAGLANAQASPKAEAGQGTRPSKAAAKRFIKAERFRPAVPKLAKRHLVLGLNTETHRGDGRVFREAVEFPASALGSRIFAVLGLRAVDAVPFSYRKGTYAADGSRNHEALKVTGSGALVSKMFDRNGVHGYAQTEFSDAPNGATKIELSESIGRDAARADAAPTVQRRIARVDGKLRIRSSYTQKLAQLGASVEYHRDEAETGADATHTFKIRDAAGQDYVSLSLAPTGELTIDAQNMKAGPQGRLSIFGSKVAVSSLKRLIQGSQQLATADKARLQASLDAAHAGAF